MEACGADGVHVGQDDATPAQARARRRAGPDRRPLHPRARRRPTAADADPDVDYLAVGPVHATPTKPGRPAAGLDYVAHAARTVGEAVVRDRRARRRQRAARWSSAGATRIVVVRAITEADDPEAAARALRARSGKSLGPSAASESGAPRRPRARRAARRWQRGYARSRERDEAIRAGLEPLAPGERPLAVDRRRCRRRLSRLANVILVVGRVARSASA